MQTFQSFIIYLRLEGGISSPVRYSYLLNFPYDNANIFASSLLISYCNFSSLILSSIIMILCEGFSDARITSVNKKKCGCAVHFFKVNDSEISDE